jgi:acetyl-CoA synthetase
MIGRHFGLEESMSEKIYPVQQPAKTRALIDKKKYRAWYEESVGNPDKF